MHGRKHPASAPESPLNRGPALLKRGSTADAASFKRLLSSPLNPVPETQPPPPEQPTTLESQLGYDADDDARVAAQNTPYPVGFP